LTAAENQNPKAESSAILTRLGKTAAGKRNISSRTEASEDISSLMIFHQHWEPWYMTPCITKICVIA
jgi:hypothetical protein